MFMDNYFSIIYVYVDKQLSFLCHSQVVHIMIIFSNFPPSCFSNILADQEWILKNKLWPTRHGSCATALLYWKEI